MCVLILREMCHKSRENFFVFCSCVFCTSGLDPCPHKSHVAIGIWQLCWLYGSLSPFPCYCDMETSELLQFLPVLSSLFGFHFLAIVYYILSSLLLILLPIIFCPMCSAHPPGQGTMPFLCSYASFLALLGAGLHSGGGSGRGSSRILEVKVKWRVCLFKLWRSQARKKIMIYFDSHKKMHVDRQQLKGAGSYHSCTTQSQCVNWRN